MTIEPTTQISAGQLWAIPDRGLFVVDRTDGPDSCYPIVLRELARHPKWADYCASTVSGYANSETAESNAVRAARWNAPAVMEQERRWFELSKVSYWAGDVPEWCRENDGKLVAYPIDRSLIESGDGAFDVEGA